MTNTKWITLEEAKELFPPRDTGLTCSICGSKAVLAKGSDIYPNKKGLRDLNFWECSNKFACDARVGCHKGTDEPLGELASLQTRTARSAAHKAFDPLWKKGTMSRKAAYGWLARVMGLEESQCHIALFNVEQCNEVIRKVKRETNQT